MLRFTEGLLCHVFRLEIALVLHHASTWGVLSGAVVRVIALADRAHGENSLHGWDLAVDLDTPGDVAARLAQLHGYLSRILPPQYELALEPSRVHVEWNAGRQPRELAAEAELDEPPPG